MSFTTLPFIAFFALTAALWYLLPQRFRKSWLLAGCWIFYMCARPAFVLLLIAGTAVSWLCALACQHSFWGRRKLWITLGVGYTLGLLFLFKYLDFFCATLLPALGLPFQGFSLALPVGISFFSFAVSGYLFDVYRGKLSAEQSFLDYALFVAFFPTLLAGPIGRAREFLPQLKTLPSFDGPAVRRGFLRFLWGAVKKMVVADLLGSMVDLAYADPSSMSGTAMLFAVCCYSLQIYYDFSAYSDMAVGASQMLGFRVTENFRAPYLSVSVKEFWKKWHISLTSWFREYLYFPLGGSRGSALRTNVNVLIVFAVSGLWHGAAWTFVIWGVLNGFYQVIGGRTQTLRRQIRNLLRIREDALWLTLLRYGSTFLLLTASWIFFRSGSLEQALTVLSRILLISQEGLALASLSVLLSKRVVLVLALLLPLCLAEDVMITKGKALPAIENTPFLYWGIVLLLLLTLSLFGVYGAGFNPQDFLYFNF